jgi:hypothetical protein
MLRSSGRWNAVWAGPRDRRFGCRELDVVVVKIVGVAFATSTFVHRAGRAGIRFGGTTSSGSKSLSVKAPRASGFWLMRTGSHEPVTASPHDPGATLPC